MPETLFLTSLQTGRYWKRCFLHHSRREDTGNTVSCITPNGKMLETAFLASLQTGRYWKRCFWHHSKRKDTGNSVSGITPNGKMQETVFLCSVQREWKRKQCCSDQAIWNLDTIASTFSIDVFVSDFVLRHSAGQRLFLFKCLCCLLGNDQEKGIGLWVSDLFYTFAPMIFG